MQSCHSVIQKLRLKGENPKTNIKTTFAHLAYILRQDNNILFQSSNVIGVATI